MAKILIIDDDPAIREVLQGGLREQGFTVFQVSDGTRGLALLAEKRPDVVLLDLMMPGMDGFEICKRIKTTPATAAIAVVFVTARSAAADIERGLLIGADDYITKPFDIYQLGDRLMNLIQRRDQAGEKPKPSRSTNSGRSSRRSKD